MPRGRKSITEEEQKAKKDELLQKETKLYKELGERLNNDSTVQKFIKRCDSIGIDYQQALWLLMDRFNKKEVEFKKVVHTEWE